MALSDNFNGAMLMTAAMTAFAVNDTFIKLLGADVPFFQILFLRSVATVCFLGIMAWYAGALAYRYRRADRVRVVIRTLSEIGAAFFFINALIHLPIANVTAIIQALPLTVTLGAALFLGEHVGWRRFAAIGVGFVGVLLIVRPGAAEFNFYALYALGAVACVTVRDLAARRLSRDVPSVSVAFVAAVGVLIFSIIGATVTDWVPMSSVHWFWIAGAVAAIICAYLLSVMAMRRGDIGAVAPFRYSALLVALALGWFVFNDWPDDLTMLGAAIVVGTGLFALWRERRAAVRE
ncbi:MAG: DMT family transporter [Paracoccaceae bacterium]|nr:DMT family transporter [Paracoccaceae bacterium]